MINETTDHVDLFFLGSIVFLENYTQQFIYSTYEKSHGLGKLLKKYSRRIEMKTFYKLLLYSYDNGAQKKTNMATNCKMSYTRFVPILQTMILFGFLEIENTPSARVKITELGKCILEKLQNAKDIN